MRRKQSKGTSRMSLGRKRVITTVVLIGLWIVAGIGALTWPGEETSAQTTSCGIVQLTAGQASTANINAAISDDGTRVAFAAARNPIGSNPDINQEVFIYNVTTGVYTQVTTTTGGVNNQVSISADGSRVAFISNRNLTGTNADLNLEVFFYDVATSTTTQVTDTVFNVPPGSGLQFVPKISADGSHIAFLSTSNLTGNNADHNEEYFLYRITPTPVNLRQLTTTNGTTCCADSAPGINADGTEINFLHTGNLNGQNPDGNLELFSWHFLTQIQHMTSTTGGGAFESFTSPSMDNTGSRYAFSSVHNLNGTNPEGDHEIFLLEGSVFTAVTQNNGSWLRKTWPDLSSAGNHIAFQGDRNIVRYDILSGEFTVIPATPPISSGLVGSRRPSISSDGSRIAFFSDDNLTGGNIGNHNEIFLATCATTTPTPGPAAITVNQSDDAGDGICDQTCSLRDAVLLANSTVGAPTVSFAGHISDVTLNGLEIAITDALTIDGPGAHAFTIDGGPTTSSRIFHIDNANVTISDVTLTGGNGQGATLNNSGGAILATGGTVLLERVHVTGNTASTMGGGLSLQDGTFRIRNSTISGNDAGTDCGGVAVGGTSSLFVVNTTISGNSAANNGGGACTQALATFRNSTITENTADQGGGIYHPANQLALGNTIVAGNNAFSAFPEIFFDTGTIGSNGYNLIGDSAGDAQDTSTAIAYQPEDILNTPPRLVGLGNYGGPTPTHPAQLGSPVIDGGTPGLANDPFDGSAITTDQRGSGFARAMGNEVDIGAFEVQDTRTYVTQTIDANGACDDDCTLREAVAASPDPGIIDFDRQLAGTNITLNGSAVDIDKELTISGIGADLLTIHGGTSMTPHNIFTITSGPVRISDLTLEGGHNLPGPGGAIYTQDQLTLERIHFLGSVGARGGAVYFHAASTIQQVVRECVFSANTAGHEGGAIYNHGNDLAIVNSTFVNNLGPNQGGAIYTIGSGTTELRNVTITGNTAAGGAGIAVTGGILELGNSIVAGNTPTPGTGDFPEILFLAGAVNSVGSNLVGDAAGDAANTFNPIMYQMSDILDTPPMLGPLQNNGGHTPTLALGAGSPAIDAGDNAIALLPITGDPPLLTDQRGFFRAISAPPAVAMVDIGAYEFGSQASWFEVTPVATNLGIFAGPVQITFPNVTQAGITTVSPIAPSSAGPLPAGFTLGPGLPAFEISTTAIFSPPVIVCIQVPSVSSPIEFARLNIFHLENGVLVNRTVSRDFPMRRVCASVTSFSPFVVAFELAPTAASVTVAGRISTSDGYAVSNAVVTITNQIGEVKTARSGPFGYYSFDSIEVGQLYILNASHKRYQFVPRALSVIDEVTDADLVADPAEVAPEKRPTSWGRRNVAAE